MDTPYETPALAAVACEALRILPHAMHYPWGGCGGQIFAASVSIDRAFELVDDDTAEMALREIGELASTDTGERGESARQALQLFSRQVADARAVRIEHGRTLEAGDVYHTRSLIHGAVIQTLMEEVLHFA
jgi:hypothetical protein